MPDKPSERVNFVLDWITVILDVACVLVPLGLMLTSLAIGLWPMPFELRPGAPPMSQELVRLVALTGSGVMIPLLYFQIWLLRKRRKWEEKRSAK